MSDDDGNAFRLRKETTIGGINHGDTDEIEVFRFSQAGFSREIRQCYRKRTLDRLFSGSSSGLLRVLHPVRHLSEPVLCRRTETRHGGRRRVSRPAADPVQGFRRGHQPGYGRHYRQHQNPPGKGKTLASDLRAASGYQRCDALLDAESQRQCAGRLGRGEL